MRLALLIALLLLALPTGAFALPGDPPPALLDPADGAVVGPDPRVLFACPAYRKFETGTFTAYGDYTDYEVVLATRPEVGADGVLLDGNVVFRDVQPLPDNSGPDRCTADLGVATPGTYYLQADRSCTGCASGRETSPVQRLELRVVLDLRLSVQRRAFKGYPFVVSARAVGVPDGGKVAVERRVDGRWRRVASLLALGGRAHGPAVLPRGRWRLRARAVLGSQSGVSPVRRVRVVRARKWATTRRDDGRYRAGDDVSLRVARSGRLVRDFAATVSTFCPGSNTFVTGTAAVRRVKVAPDGRFYSLSHPGRETTVELSGRLRRRSLTGSVRLVIGACEGSTSFGAERSGSR